VITPGEAVTSWGTSGTVLAPTDTPRVDPRLRAHTFCHVAPNTWYIMGVVLSAGGAFAWFRDQLARDLVGTGEANERLNAEASAIPAGAEGVTFLPYLQGERTPHRDASARGSFTGLSLAHSRSHLARAVVEGVCFALRDSVSILDELRMAPSQCCSPAVGQEPVCSPVAGGDLRLAGMHGESRGRPRRTARRSSPLWAPGRFLTSRPRRRLR
jgi:xylulokinase